MAKRPAPKKISDKDLELLLYACTAMGWRFISVQDNRFVVSRDGGKTTYHWNPLSDPGDALTLAVDLDLIQTHMTRWSKVTSEGRLIVSCCVPHKDRTPVEAACLAITMCAAEIGRKKSARGS